MRVPRWAWIAWLVVGVGLEALALLSDAAGDTFTEYAQAAGLGWLAAGFGAWLVKHFTDGS